MTVRKWFVDTMGQFHIYTGVVIACVRLVQDQARQSPGKGGRGAHEVTHLLRGYSQLVTTGEKESAFFRDVAT